jgi:hypothetical protein
MEIFPVPTDPFITGQRGFRKLNGRIENFSVQYQRAESILTSLVARTVLAGTLGLPKVRRAVRAQAKVMLDELDAKGIAEGQRIVEDAYQLGIRMAAQEHVVQGRINDQAISLLKANLKERLGDATTHVGRRVDDVFRKEALRLAASSLAGEGEPFTESEVLQRRLVKQGITAFQDRRGRTWGLAQYARMAVKTTSAEAVFHGTQTTMIAANLDVVEVNSVLRPCPRCKPYDGGTFSLTGRSKYPLLDTTFPIHPSCQHYIVPGREAFDERRAVA